MQKGMANCMDTSEDTFDVTAVCKLKHADLWGAAKRLGSQRALARHLGIRPEEVGRWINLQEVPPAEPVQSPTTKWTEEFFTGVEAKLAALTGKSWDELFPTSLRENAAFLACDKTVERTASVQHTALLAYAHATSERLSLTHEHAAKKEAMIDEVKQQLDSLSEREREIIKLRFGFYGEPMNLEQTGERMKICRERVRQIEAKAIRKLQEGQRAQRLASYV